MVRRLLQEELPDRQREAMLLVMVGVQLITMGLLGEMISRTYHESQNKPIYSIREELG